MNKSELIEKLKNIKNKLEISFFNLQITDNNNYLNGLKLKDHEFKKVLKNDDIIEELGYLINLCEENNTDDINKIEKITNYFESYIDEAFFIYYEAIEKDRK